MDSQPQAEDKKFIEDFGIFFEQTGLPRMAGRVLGWLLICDSPHQSPDELAKALMASKGSISSTTRLLIQFGLIERFSLPGIRHDYLRINPDVWQHYLKHHVEQISTLLHYATRGLELTKNNSPQAREALVKMHSMYTFFKREFPALQERWEQEHQREESQVKQSVGK
ncbi:GbsR/MarR family transcriptional regulator [Chloroflexota bacterium]